MMITNAKGLLLCGASFLLFSSPAHAQQVRQEAAQATANPEAMADDQSSGEIVVTATRRSESLKDIPQSISALSDEMLQSRGVTDITALGRQTPGLVMNERADKTPNVVMRGVGAFGNVQGVGFYIDDVQNFTDQTMRLQDLQRIEVLKGPQGTLYGGSSIGGAVRYITKEPGWDISANALVEGGSKGYRNAYGALNLPLVNDQVAARVSGYYTHDDGFMRSRALSNLATTEEYAFRGQLLVKPTDRLTALFSLRYRNFSGGALLANPQDSVSNVSYVADLSIKPKVRSKTFGGVAKINYDFDGVVLDWISSYTKQDKDILSDADYTTTAQQQTVIFSVNPRPTKILTQEIRLSSEGDQKFAWILGLYAARLDNANVAPTPLTAVVTIPALNRVVTRPNFYSYDIDQTDLAAFASTDLHLGDFTLTTGARVYRVKYNADVFTARSAVLNAHYDRDDTAILPRLALSYKTVDGNNLYASVSRGYEPGRVAISSATIAPYNPEKTWAFEAGSKGYVAGRSIYYEVAGFYSIYSDRQFETRVLIGGLPTETIDNIGDSKSYGFEGSLNWTLARGLVVNGSLGYLHARWKSNVIYKGVDISGKTPPNSPTWTGNVGATYSTPLSDALKVELHADASFTDEFRWKLGYEPVSSVNPSYWIASAYIAISELDDRWKLAARVSNIFNQAYYTDFTPQLFGAQGANGTCNKCHLGYVGDKRRIIVSASMKF